MWVWWVLASQHLMPKQILSIFEEKFAMLELQFSLISQLFSSFSQNKKWTAPFRWRTYSILSIKSRFNWIKRYFLEKKRIFLRTSCYITAHIDGGKLLHHCSYWRWGKLTEYSNWLYGSMVYTVFTQLYGFKEPTQKVKNFIKISYSNQPK
jgi:hypothetical protein